MTPRTLKGITGARIVFISLLTLSMSSLHCAQPGDSPGAGVTNSTGNQDAGSERIVIATPNAPAALGPYSQAIQHGNLLFLAGQIGIDPATGTLVEGIEAQTRQALTNLGAVLEAAGFGFGDVVQAQVFLADLNDYKPMNDVYAEFFTDQPPGRAAVEVARIPRDGRVEIMLTAAR